MTIKKKPPFTFLYFTFLYFTVFSSLFAQKNFDTPSFDVQFVTKPQYKIDGVMNEPDWSNHLVAKDFWQYFPTDTLQAKAKTEVYMFYDEMYLYIAAKCFTVGKKFIIPSLKRDYRAGGNDNISFVFDTFNDQTNAFLFGLNPMGVMREALISNGGSDLQYFNAYWDNKWEGNSKMYDDYWTCELKIPLKTLRYKEGSVKWNFMSYRFDSQTNESSSWVRIPQNQLIFNLAFTGPMNFKKPLAKPGVNLAVIPYLRTGLASDFTKKPTKTTPQNGIGLDAKIAITSGMVLDLTVNPDFSTVEADRQIQNLTRFDISYSYPEQRLFFLENSDLFGNFGNQNITPFFSRRVGLATDTTTGLYTPNRILYGARLNGKLGDNWRIGVMNLQTDKDETKGISDANTTVAVVQRKLFSRSNISAILVNKQTLSPELNSQLSAYNRVGGLEYNLASKDNRWLGKLYYYHAFTPSKEIEKGSTGLFLTYNVPKFQLTWAQDWVGKDFEAEAGFVPRRDVFHIFPQAQLNFYPRGRLINKHNIGVSYEQFSMPKLGVTDESYALSWNPSFQNTSQLTISLIGNYTYLFGEFDPTRSGKTPLKLGTSYRYNNVQAMFFSNQRNKIGLIAQATAGQYFDGTIVSLSGAATYRLQPFGTLTGNFSFSQIKSTAGSSTLFLIGPRTDITFSKSVFWTTFLQYNSLSNNVNINSRLQWRFKPVSDFFLVYSDNYFADTFLVKNRAIIAKLTYWFNV
jgi:hypothetical protein